MEASTERLSHGHAVVQPAVRRVAAQDADWHLLRRLDAGPFRITLKHYGPSFQQGVHCHALGAIDFNLAGGGCGTYVGRAVESRPGTVELFAPDREHSFCAGPSGIRTMHVAFGAHVLADAVGGGIGDSVHVDASIDQATAAGIGTRLLLELRDPDDSSPMAAEALAFELLAASHAWRRKPERGVRWLQWVRDHVHAEPGVTLKRLAALAGVHRAHLARSFSAQYGVSVGEYQRRLRLANAAQRIASGDGSLTRAAHACGFSDQAHLTRWFVRVLGVTPGAYARAMKSERVALRAWPRA